MDSFCLLRSSTCTTQERLSQILDSFVTEAASLATASNAAAVVTNQQPTDLTVVKEWLDHGNAYKTRPDHLS